ELDFSINDIQQLLNAEDFDLLSALESQKTLLLERQKKTNAMLNSIEATMTNIQGKRNVDIIFEDLPKEKLELWDNLSKDALGISFSSVVQRVSGNLSEDQARCLKEENEALAKEYVDHINFPIESREIQDLVRRFIQLSSSMMQGASMG